MDNLLGFVCALLYVWNSGLNTEAGITGWEGKAVGHTIPNTKFSNPAIATITLSASTALGSTLFTLTASASTTVWCNEFSKNPDGNPGYYGEIAMIGTSCVVTLRKAINYSTVKELRFEILASDQSTPLGSFVMTVKFGQSTDSAFSFCVADPTPLGTVISKSIPSVSTGYTTLTGGDAAKFMVETDGSIKTAAMLESSDKVYYTTTLKLTDGATNETDDWPLHVLVDNSYSCSGVVHVISSVAMIVMTVLAYTVV